MTSVQLTLLFGSLGTLLLVLVGMVGFYAGRTRGHETYAMMLERLVTTGAPGEPKAYSAQLDDPELRAMKVLNDPTAINGETDKEVIANIYAKLQSESNAAGRNISVDELRNEAQRLYYAVTDGTLES